MRPAPTGTVDSRVRDLKVCIAGGAGFIGSNIVEVLFRRGQTVCVIGNLSTGRRSNLEPFSKNVEPIEGDIHSLEVLRAALAVGPGT